MEGRPANLGQQRTDSQRVGGLRVRTHSGRIAGPICRYWPWPCNRNERPSTLWAPGDAFSSNPTTPAVQSGLKRASELAPADYRYNEMAVAIEGGIDTVPVASTAVPLPSVQTLIDQLATGFGIVQNSSRSVAARQLEATDEPALFVAFTYGLPPESASARHIVSIHRALPGGWLELDRAELECVNYLDEFSLEQVKIEAGQPLADCTGRGRRAWRLPRSAALGRTGFVTRHQQFQQYPRCGVGHGSEWRRPIGSTVEQQRPVHILLRLRPATLHGAVLPTGTERILLRLPPGRCQTIGLPTCAL